MNEFQPLLEQVARQHRTDLAEVVAGTRTTRGSGRRETRRHRLSRQLRAAADRLDS